MVDRRILLVRLAKADVRCQIFHWRIHDNHSGFRESAWPHELAALCAADSLFGSSGAGADQPIKRSWRARSGQGPLVANAPRLGLRE